MKGGREDKGLKSLSGIAGETRTSADLVAAEDMLARLVSFAYAADHPETFSIPKGGAQPDPTFRGNARTCDDDAFTRPLCGH